MLQLIGSSFMEKFFNLMAWLAGISLLCFSYNIFVGMLPAFEYSEGHSSLLLYTQVHLNNLLLERNCGMFWEPGAYQGFLNLALFFSLYIKRQVYHRLKVGLLIIALLTTFSTTGYMGFAFVCMLYILDVSRLNTFQKVFGIIMLCSTSVYAYYTLDFMSSKISQDLQLEEGGRITSYVFFINDLSDYIFLGRSYISELIYTGGNGFLFHLYSIGIVGVFYYYASFVYRIGKQTSLKFTMGLMLLLILIYQGEGFIAYPLFLGIAFMKPIRMKKFIR